MGGALTSNLSLWAARPRRSQSTDSTALAALPWIMPRMLNLPRTISQNKSADTPGCRACGNNQGRLDPWSLDAIDPWTTWSQVVKGRTTGANWLRVVTPYPLGTQSGPLRLPYGSLMVGLWLAYAPLMVGLRPPYGPLPPPFRLRKRRPAKARFSLVVH